ncbi:MAG TPA: rhombosortase [Hyphomicrobiaceae bacterium]|nr:rhombosortase [Hyphomicrobiaceae bacterium]
MTIRRKSAHGKQCLPWVTLGLTALCLELYALFGGAPDMLVYDRAEIQNGQWWRLATGHLVHLDLHHLVYNTGALLALGILYETASFGGSGKLAFGVFGLAGAVITTALFVGSPATLYYCGLSAALNALYTAATIGMWRETGQRIWLAAFGLDIAKISWESASEPIFSSTLAWPPHTGAHAAGVVAGCALALWSAFECRVDDNRSMTAPRPNQAH